MLVRCMLNIQCCIIIVNVSLQFKCCWRTVQTPMQSTLTASQRCIRYSRDVWCRSPPPMLYIVSNQARSLFPLWGGFHLGVVTVVSYPHDFYYSYKALYGQKLNFFWVFWTPGNPPELHPWQYLHVPGKVLTRRAVNTYQPAESWGTQCIDAMMII